MERAQDNLVKIVKRMNENPKALQVFVTDVGGKPVNWNTTFQFNLDNENPFYLIINNQKISINEGTSQKADIVMSGDNSAITKICQGKGDFTHAISREEIKVENGKVMDIIRLTRAITIVLKTK
ncbi:MAG: SCP2 sterol-binding domain-containing protein [Candidatus Lokiarchaeota archaeon]|nr:SCP2 sterol-binding domain-containing protein [Candidatus Lokiarchaeota archaeon]